MEQFLQKYLWNFPISQITKKRENVFESNQFAFKLVFLNKLIYTNIHESYRSLSCLKWYGHWMDQYQSLMLLHYVVSICILRFLFCLSRNTCLVVRIDSHCHLNKLNINLTFSLAKFTTVFSTYF
jgi:hypothetical protein